MGKGFFAFVLSSSEIGVIAWCALWPIRDEILGIRRPQDLLAQYDPAYSALDVLFLSIFRLLLSMLITLTTSSLPSFRTRSKRSYLRLPNHQLRRSVLKFLLLLTSSLLLAKAAYVAVAAPDQLQPDVLSSSSFSSLPSPSSPSSPSVSSFLPGPLFHLLSIDPPRHTIASSVPSSAPLLVDPTFRPFNIGLYRMFGSIVVALLLGPISEAFWSAAVTTREDRWWSVASLEPSIPGSTDMLTQRLLDSLGNGGGGGNGGGSGAKTHVWIWFAQC
mmetsp:Transcript_24683/g.44429  ORF Transcript_24683/g.44429 Transcript_24683/m.44429 type:complete len:274 (+) Transcript_24683:99-920(+)